jgi:hypothetical protein
MKIEKRINLKFFVKLKKINPTEYFQLLKEVYGDNFMSCTGAFEWHRWFMEGQEEVEDDEHPEPPSTSKT